MVHVVSIRHALVAKVELNSGDGDVDPVHGDEPAVNSADVVGNTVVYPESNHNCTNVNPSEGLLQRLIVELEPHPYDINDKPDG